MISARSSFFDQLIVSGSNFFIVVLAARLLEAEEVAKYAYAFAFYILLYMVANAWIYQNIMAIGQKKLESDGLLLNFSRLNYILVLFSIPVSLFLFQLLVSGSFSNVLWVESGLVAVFIAVNQMIDYERRILYFSAHSPLKGPALVSTVGFLVRVIALVIVQPGTFEEFMITLIIFSLPALYFSVKRFSYSPNNDFILFVAQQIKNGKWMTLNIPVNWAWGQAPVFIVGAFLGLRAAGVYAAIRSISNIANVVMEMIPTYFASRLSNLFSSGKMNEYKKYMLVYVGAGVMAWGLALSVIFLFGENILELLLGDGYSSYWKLFLLFWIFNILVFFTRFQFIHLRFVEKTYVTPLANLVGVFALCVSFFLWFDDKGVLGIAWAMIFGAITIVYVQYICRNMVLSQ
ncbi:MAG: hypothetical protein IMY67_09850 [Bacteroidetes bacterium]|nr:hypothetical protein [Bacteroidota bacterium]